MEFGAGIFVDLNKEKALRAPDKNNSVSYGRVTRDALKRIANKKDLFQICAAAAAALDVDNATVS